VDVKRIFRGPWLWIVLAVVGVLLALQFLSSDGGYDEITTSKMTSDINSGEGLQDHLRRRGPGDPGDPRRQGAR
jgi:hypothetical protein